MKPYENYESIRKIIAAHLGELPVDLRMSWPERSDGQLSERATAADEVRGLILVETRNYLLRKIAINVPGSSRIPRSATSVPLSRSPIYLRLILAGPVG